jgi:glycine/D-amino acid oxidase-like deaminating enzyme
MATNQPTYHIIVVGAGVFGAAAALALRQRGHAVCLFDPGPLPHPDASSTDISKVIRMDYGTDEFYTTLMEEAFPKWDAWNELWSYHPRYHQDGFLLLSKSEMRPGGFEHDSYQLISQRGHTLERLDAAALQAKFPAFNAAHYPDGYFNPRAGWAESGEVVGEMIALCGQAGVSLCEGYAFERLIEKGSKVTGIMTTDGQKHPADFVVMAAGAWTPVLLPHLAELMWPVGQPVLHFQVDDPAAYQPPHFTPWGADIANTGWYGFPAQDDGTLKIGYHGPGQRVDPREAHQIPADHEAFCRQFLSETFPSLVDAPLIKTRLCFYCDTWDGNFYIDHDPNHEGLFLATGGSGHGFKFAPVLGPIIADALERKPNPYAHRFAWRPRGQRLTEGARYTGK